MGTRSKQYKRTLKTADGKPVEVNLDAKTLMEAMNPALSSDELLIPGFNSVLLCEKDIMVPKYKDGTPRLKIMFLTPHYEQQMLELIYPIIEEFRKFLEEMGESEFNWKADMAAVISSLGQRLIGSLKDYNRTMADAAAIICQASLELHRIYNCEEVTPEDRAVIAKLNSNWFYKNVPGDYIFKYIIVPQYHKMAIADMISSFFLTIARYLQVGAGNLIQKATSLTTATTSPS